MAEWISVKDRLPEKDGVYLVYRNRPDPEILEFTTNLFETFENDLKWLSTVVENTSDFGPNDNRQGFYECEEDITYKYGDDGDIYCHYSEAKVTHWMPLPEPPADI